MRARKLSLDQIRSEVCDLTQVSILAFGILALFLSFLRIPEIGWRPVMGLHIAAVMVLAGITLLRRHIFFRVRAAVVVAILLTIGVSGLVANGSPFGLAYFVSGAILAAVFFNEKVALATVLFALVAMAGVYAAFRYALLVPPDPTRYVLLASTWTLQAGNIVVTTLGPLIAIMKFGQRLESERQRAEDANEAKSNFLATMSHELRTPMTAILGISDLLLGDRLSQSQTAQVSRLRKSARALLDLLNELLDFSKIEADKLVITPVSFSLMELVGEVDALLSPLAKEKDLAFRVEYQPDMKDALIGDAVRLRQILINLMGNAIKFTDAGSIVLRVSQKRRDDDAILLCCDVVDTGIGMSTKLQTTLFQPFVQGNQGFRRRYEGTGLGLAITKRLLQLMKGEISFSSSPGAGSTFSFLVPVSLDTGDSPTGSASTAPPLRPSRRLRILVADDNETNRYLIEMMLSRWGHEVVCVENGAEALERIQTDTYDVVLMDVHMPVLDGIAATREIRQLGGNVNKLRVVGLTADVLEDHCKSCLAAGMDAVVGKPVDWVVLSTELDRLCDSASVLSAKERGWQRVIAQPPSERNDVLDHSVFTQIERDIGPEALGNLMPSLRKSITEAMAEISAAVAEGDLKKVKRTCHTLKGVCAHFGAVEVGNFARFIETEAVNLDGVRELLTDMTDAVDALDLALAQKFASSRVDPVHEDVPDAPLP